MDDASFEEVMNKAGTSVYRPGENLPTDHEMKKRQVDEENAMRHMMAVQQVSHIEGLRDSLLRGERPALKDTQDDAKGLEPGELLMERAANFKTEANAHFVHKNYHFANKGYLTALWLLKVVPGPFSPMLTPAADDEKPRGEDTIALLGEGRHDGDVKPLEGYESRAQDLRIALHANVAACALALDDLATVVAACDYVLSLEPSHVKARYRLSMAREQEGELGKAESLLTALVKESGNNGETRASLHRVRKLREKRRKESAAMSRFLEKSHVYSDDEQKGRRKEARAQTRQQDSTAAPVASATTTTSPQPIDAPSPQPIDAPSQMQQDQLSKVAPADRDALMKLHAEGGTKEELVVAYSEARRREIERVSGLMTPSERTAFAEVAANDALSDEEADAHFETYRCEVAIRGMLEDAPEERRAAVAVARKAACESFDALPRDPDLSEAQHRVARINADMSAAFQALNPLDDAQTAQIAALIESMKARGFDESTIEQQVAALLTGTSAANDE